MKVEIEFKVNAALENAFIAHLRNCECDLYVRNGTENNSPEAAALKVWLKLKGIEYAE